MNKLRPALTTADWCRLNQLLEQALALEADARASWLETLPEDTADLHGVLRELLAESAVAADCPDGAMTHVPTAVAWVAADALAAMRRERPGDRIGPWQLQRLVAEGGMGAVWVAQRVDGVMQRTAALKLPRAEWVDSGLTERIARERAILARLQHPHIAVLYDAGVAGDGRPFLALEYVDGVPIDEFCRGHDLPTVLRLFVLVARAVAYAHAQLVIHRDLKPANVLVTKDGLPKLLDFGISKLMEGETPLADESALTRLGGRRLTLAYAAPEQVLGLPISVAADVYALGVMLFELLAQRRPYRSRDARTLEGEILRGEPPRPSAETADKARSRALRGDLDAIMLTALRRDPAARYQTAAALADDLDNYLAGRPVTAQPDSRLYRMRKFVARNALPVAAGAAIVVALGIGLATALWQAQRATALNAFVLSLIRQGDPNATQQTRAADLAMLASIENKIDQDFKGAPDQLLELRLTVGEAYFNRGEMMAARRVFQRAADEGAAHVAADDLMLLTAQVRASDHNLIVSTAASQQLDRAIVMLRPKARSDDAAAALLIDALLIRMQYRHEYGVPAFVPADQRMATIREATDYARSRFGAGSRHHLRTLNPLALWTWRIEGRAAARQEIEAALGASRKRTDGAADSVEYLVAEGELAALRCEENVDLDESMITLRRSLDVVRAAHGAASVKLESLLIDLGRCTRASGHFPPKLPEAEAYEVAAARERPPSTNLMRRAYYAFDRALHARDLAGAETFYRSAMANAAAIDEETLRRRLTGQTRIMRTCHLALQGQADEAVEVAAPLVAEAHAVYATIGRMTPRQGELWTCLASAQRQLGRHAEALASLQTLFERGKTMQFSAELRRWVEGELLVERALIELDQGQAAAARATMAERLALSRDMTRNPMVRLAHGRALLAAGKPAEAFEPLRLHYESWKALNPDNPHTAEALYWLGRAREASGAPDGRTMIAEARVGLARSPAPAHRRLGGDGRR